MPRRGLARLGRTASLDRLALNASWIEATPQTEVTDLDASWTAGLLTAGLPKSPTEHPATLCSICSRASGTPGATGLYCGDGRQRRTGSGTASRTQTKRAKEPPAARASVRFASAPGSRYSLILTPAPAWHTISSGPGAPLALRDIKDVSAAFHWRIPLAGSRHCH